MDDQRSPSDRYQVWYYPAVQRVRILEDRKAETKEFGTRLVLRVQTGDGEVILFSVLSTLAGPHDRYVEEVRNYGTVHEGAYRIERETEETYLAAWGF